MSRKLTGGMAAALERTQKVAADIRGLQSGRPQLEQLSLDDIVPSPFQARLDFSGLETLAEDIRSNGVLQPVLVRPLPGDRYELVAGERRWRASRLAGQSHIPAVVRPLDDAQARLYGLKENLERQDLNPYELTRAALDLAALSLGRGAEELKVQAARRGAQLDPEVREALEAALEVLGRPLALGTFQRHYLPLLDMPGELLDAVREGVPYAAVSILAKATPEQQAEWLPRLLSGEWSVRDVEKALKAAGKPGAKAFSGEEAQQAGKRLSRLITAEKWGQLAAPERRRAEQLLRDLEALLAGQKS